MAPAKRHTIISRAARLGAWLLLAAPFPAHAANPLNFFFPVENDLFTTVDDEIAVKPVHWTQGNIGFVVFDQGGYVVPAPANFATDDVVFAIVHALQAWNKTDFIDTDFDDSVEKWSSGFIDPPLPTGPNLDGHNLVTFRSSALTGDSTIAATSFFFMEHAISKSAVENLSCGEIENPAGAACIEINGSVVNIPARDYEQGEIFEADIAFSPSLDYHIWPQKLSDVPDDELPLVAGSLDIQAIMTHELGHVLGAAHSYLASATMFPFFQADDAGYPTNPYNMRVPDLDDELAVGAVYDTFGTALGEIQGEVYDGQFVQNLPEGTLPDPANKASAYEQFRIQTPVFLGLPLSTFADQSPSPDDIPSADGTIRLIAQTLTGEALNFPAGSGGVASLEPAEGAAPNIDFNDRGAALNVNALYRFRGLPARTDYVIGINPNILAGQISNPIAINPIYNNLESLKADYLPEYYGGTTCGEPLADSFDDDVTSRLAYVTAAAGVVTANIDFVTNLAESTPCPAPSPTATPNPSGNMAEFDAVRFPALAVGNDIVPVQVTVRNTGTTTWTPEAGYQLASSQNLCLAYPERWTIAAGASVAPGASYTFTGSAVLPNGTGNCPVTLQMLREGFEYFGESRTAKITLDTSLTLDFTANGGDANGWYGGVAQGSGEARLRPEGLCLDAPLTGDNAILWASPDHYAELVDEALYRARLTVSTTQIATDAIPFWNFVYDNYNGLGPGNTYGGQSWFLDNTGGASGVGRPNGRTSFDVYMTPNCVRTPQWRGLLADGTQGAFTSAADPWNDMRCIFRVLDLGSAGINANIDSGRLCMSALRIDRYAIPALLLTDLVYTTAITNNTHAAYTYQQHPLFAEIDDTAHTATYRLGSVNDRATLIPAFDLDPPNKVYSVTSLYPVAWNSDTLYRVTADIQTPETESGTDPIDAIGINVDVPSVEIGGVSVSTRGNAPDSLPMAAAPRKASVANGPQTYMLFFHSSNSTDYETPGFAYIRPMADFFNAESLYQPGTGNDAVQVTDLEMARMNLPF